MMAFGLKALTRFASSPMVDRLGVRQTSERALYRASRDGFRLAGAAARTFAAATGERPERLRPTGGAGAFDLTPTEEQQMLQEACRKAQDPAELGLTLLGIPEALGGAFAQRSTVTAVLVAQALATRGMGRALAALSPGAAAAALALYGDADQQATYMPSFAADGPPDAAVALLDNDVVVDGRRLTGTVPLVPLAESLELLVVAAGDRLHLVEVAGNGVLIKRQPTMGLEDAALGAVRLEGATAVPLGTPEDLVDARHRGRIGWSALLAGTAQAVLDAVGPYVNEREAFGEPISHRQAVAFCVSDIAIELEGMRLATLRAAARADAGRDFGTQAAVAARLCATHAPRIGSHGVQLLGGHGYVTEHPVEQYYRDLCAPGALLI